MKLRKIIIVFAILQFSLFHLTPISQISDATLMFMIGVFVSTIALAIYIWQPLFDNVT